MKFTLKTIGLVLLWTVIGILLFFILSNLYSRFLAKNGEKGIFGIGYAVVVSGSMKPAINENDFIVYKQIPDAEYEKGDIVIFEKTEEGKSRLVTHRIVALNQEHVLTKGDANAMADEEIDRKQLIGRVVWVVPYIGIGMNFLASPTGMILSGALILIVIALSVFFTVMKNENAKEKARKTAKP